MRLRENEDKQKKLKSTVKRLITLIDTAEQKSSDVTAFLKIVHKYEHIEKLTPEIMHKLIEKIVVHAPDKSNGKRIQQIENTSHAYASIDQTDNGLEYRTGGRDER